MSTQSLSEAHAKWLEDRQIPCELAAARGLWSDGRELVIPFHHTDGTVAFSKRRGPTKSFRIEPKGQPLIAWGLDRLSEPFDTLIWTEGELDGLAFIAAGLPNVVSVPNGAMSKPGEGEIVPREDRGFAFLWQGDKLRPEFARFQRHILATDNDGPGEVLRAELAIRLGRDKCWFVEYPRGRKDANDVLVKHGRQALNDLIAAARPIVPDQLVKFSDLPRSTGTSISSGWKALDPHLKFALPEVAVVTGVPNVGKSQFGLAIVAQLARVHGMRSAILQFEDDIDRHRDDLLRYATAWKLGDDPSAWIDDHFVTIAPPESIEDAEDKSLRWLLDRIEEAATRHDCRCILLDSWNEVEHAFGVGENETGYTGRALRLLRAEARRLGLLILIVVHPSKAGGLKGSIDEMTPYDIAGSAHWANKPDHVLLLHRDPESNATAIKVAKSRDYRRRGVPGTVRLAFDPHRAVYTPIE